LYTFVVLYRQRLSRIAMKDNLDNLLLELILMDTIATTGGRCIQGAERVIQRYVPTGLYDRIIERYDEISDDRDDINPHFLDPWLRLAALKDSRWKRKMILRFLCILSAGGAIGKSELSDVAALAAAMNASRECSQILCIANRTNQHPLLLARRC
jgi:hypothetical protein